VACTAFNFEMQVSVGPAAAPSMQISSSSSSIGEGDDRAFLSRMKRHMHHVTRSFMGGDDPFKELDEEVNRLFDSRGGDPFRRLDDFAKSTHHVAPQHPCDPSSPRHAPMLNIMDMVQNMMKPLIQPPKPHVRHTPPRGLVALVCQASTRRFCPKEALQGWSRLEQCLASHAEAPKQLQLDPSCRAILQASGALKRVEQKQQHQEGRIVEIKPPQPLRGSLKESMERVHRGLVSEMELLRRSKEKTSIPPNKCKKGLCVPVQPVNDKTLDEVCNDIRDCHTCAESPNCDWDPTQTPTDESVVVATKVPHVKMVSEKELNKATTGCKTDDDCKTGGDQGGYCKSNGDCHCTAPFFGSTGSTCDIVCCPKPDGKKCTTACCRDDSDCQSGGDKAAYCKSPKSTPHTEPGNGMCRCDAGFKGTTQCNKASKPSQEPHEREFNEGTPAWITGDVEAPKGHKKMPGGWTMRAYTAEQQARLGVDEEGKPVTKKAATTPQTKPTHTPKKAATDSSSGQPEPKATLSSRIRSLVGHMETKARRVPPGWWIVAGVVGLLLLFAGVNARARQQRRQELENIYRVALDDATPHVSAHVKCEHQALMVMGGSEDQL